MPPPPSTTASPYPLSSSLPHTASVFFCCLPTRPDPSPSTSPAFLAFPLSPRFAASTSRVRINIRACGLPFETRFSPDIFLSHKPWKASTLVGILTRKEDGAKERQRKRGKYTVLSWCAHSILAQSPLLYFLLKYGPYIAEILSAGAWDGEVSDCSLRNSEEDKEEEACVGYGSSPRPNLQWKTLIFGMLLGAAVPVMLLMPMDIGCVVDASLWLCVLCSLLFFVGCVIRTAISLCRHLSKRQFCLRCLASLLQAINRILADISGPVICMFCHQTSLTKNNRVRGKSSASKRLWGADVTVPNGGARKSELQVAGLLPRLLLKQFNL